MYILDKEYTRDLHFIYEGNSSLSLQSTLLEDGGSLMVARIWYDAAMRELQLSQFLGKPSLSTVQTLAILVILHRNFGEADREYFLLGIAINVSRTLGMDRLGSEACFPRELTNRREWSTRSGRELGRRLWWTLVICDWQVWLGFDILNCAYKSLG